MEVCTSIPADAKASELMQPSDGSFDRPTLPAEAIFPACNSGVSELRERLMAELSATGDPRLVDDGKFFESPPLAGPIPEHARQWGRGR